MNVSLGTPQEEATFFFLTGHLRRYSVTDQADFDARVVEVYLIDLVVFEFPFHAIFFQGPLGLLRAQFDSETHLNILRQLNSLHEVIPSYAY